MTTAERLRAEGRAEGHAEGFEIGFRIGMSEALLKLIDLRFGEADEATRARVEAADVAQLDRWTMRVLAVPTLDALFD